MTKQAEQSVHFNKLNDQEKESKLNRLLSLAKSEITIWIKGKSEKQSIEIEGPLTKQFDVHIISKNLIKDFIEQDILVTFSISGLNFFAKARCFSTNEQNFIRFDGDFFKSERRTNFRLLTDPHHEVYVHMMLEGEQDDQDSNVIGFSTGTSETGLFKNFLSMIDEENEHFSPDGYLKIRVLDLSVSGAAIQLGDLEKELIEKKESVVGKFFLEFNGIIFEIPGARIHYINELKSKSNVAKIYKSGIEFLNIGTNLDEELSKLINKALRGLDKEFEDFLS